MSETVWMKCPVCRMPAKSQTTSEGWELDCSRCGTYRADTRGIHALHAKPLSPVQIANASGYLAENQDYFIGETQAEFLRNLRTPLVSEKAMRLLRWVGRHNPEPGKRISLPDFSVLSALVERFESSSDEIMTRDGGTERAREMLPILSAGWVRNVDELVYLLSDYLNDEARLITLELPSDKFRISPAGWSAIEQGDPNESHTAFVAMWFADEMTRVWENAFYPSIYDAGYTPLRIDKKEHNNKIDDEILASIRAAKFLIADFTGQRGGVYYEAGFAVGLGKPVIWTVRHEDLSKVHFDTRQFNHIPWKMDELPDFKIALQKRIEATFGHGPIVPTSR